MTMTTIWDTSFLHPHWTLTNLPRNQRQDMHMQDNQHLHRPRQVVWKQVSLKALARMKGRTSLGMGEKGLQGSAKVLVRSNGFPLLIKEIKGNKVHTSSGHTRCIQKCHSKIGQPCREPTLLQAYAGKGDQWLWCPSHQFHQTYTCQDGNNKESKNPQSNSNRASSSTHFLPLASPEVDDNDIDINTVIQAEEEWHTTLRAAAAKSGSQYITLTNTPQENFL